MLSEIAVIVNIIVAIVTFGLVIATFMVARATKRAAEATEKTIEAQYKPWVVMYLKPNWQGNMVDLVVKNVGYGPAYDIKFALPDFFPYRAVGIEKNSAAMPKNWKGGVLRNGMSYLAAGESWTTFWGQYGGLVKGLDNKSLEICITFKTAKGAIEKSRCILDVRDYAEFDLGNFEGSVVKELKKQTDNTKSIAQSLHSISKKYSSSVTAEEIKQIWRDIAPPGSRNHRGPGYMFGATINS